MPQPTVNVKTMESKTRQAAEPTTHPSGGLLSATQLSHQGGHAIDEMNKRWLVRG